MQSRKKKNVKERSILFIRLKKNVPFFFQYIFISIYIYIYIYLKKNATFCVLVQKNKTFSRSFTFFAKERCILCKRMLLFFAFFSVLCKRTLCSLRSFPFFKKNGKERNIFLGLISRQKLEKRTEKNGTFL